MTVQDIVLSEVLSKIQKDLKAPKSQYNSFAKFHYRNCEDILEAVKKVMPDGVAVTLEDKVVRLGDRFYIKATATIWVGKSHLDCCAYARESYEKKGMDPAQITGAASSYARKYALNGLFLIDDSKDVDSRENKEDPRPPKSDYIEEFNQLIHKLGVNSEVIEIWRKREPNAETIYDISLDYLSRLISAMKKKLAEKNNV
jgi:hypothetical protein